MKFRIWHILLLLIPYQVFAAYIPQPVLHQVATSGDYAHLLNCPPLHTVATSGSYNDLGNIPNDIVKFPDTTNKISTTYKLNTLVKDTALSIRNSLQIVAYTNDYNDLINKPPADTSNPIVFYNSSGKITQPIKKWVGTITPTLATDQLINISTASFSTILAADVNAFYNGNLIWCQPYIVSNSQISVDLYRPNTSLVTILGLNVLQGVPFLSGNDLSNIRLQVEVTGY